jgi:hypothetical protein
MLRDFDAAIDAKRALIDATNFQLVALIGNSFGGNPRPLNTFCLGGKRNG